MFPWKSKKLPFPEEDMELLEKAAFTERSEASVQTVLEELDELSRVDGADFRIARFCEHAISVSNRFRRQREDFDKVLAAKFDAGEITYGRYRAVVDNAEEVSERNIEKLPYLIRSAVQTQEIRERKLIENLLRENDALLQATARLTAELSVLETNIVSKMAESTLKQLDELRKSTHLYSIHNTEKRHMD
jgi:hypothetical protein